MFNQMYFYSHSIKFGCSKRELGGFKYPENDKYGNCYKRPSVG